LEPGFSKIIENESYIKYFSIISIWEIAIKVSLGKMFINQPIDRIIPQKINILDLKIPHILKVKELPYHHRDPFDRMLIAQALAENLSIMTKDNHFKMYDVHLTDTQQIEGIGEEP